MPGYSIERFLGRGASGEVWQARVRRTGAAVALKRLPMADPEQRAAALREAAVLSALDHPHLVRLHDTVRLPDAVVLVLDLAPAGTLAQIVAARGRLIPGETVTAVAPIAAALAYAHQAGVVHGDVSPANILFIDNGMPLLADLGVARLLGCDAPVRTTPGFVDPMLTAGSVPAPASDVFMIAGVALFALTGEPPWRGGGAAEALREAEEPQRLDAATRLRAVDVPARMIDVVERALAVDPVDRGTAAEFALELRASTRAVAVELSAGRVQPVAARAARHAAAVEPVPSDEPFTEGVRRPSPLAETRHSGLRLPRPTAGASRRALAAIAVVGAAAAAAVLVAQLRRPDPSPRRPATAHAPVAARPQPAPPPEVRAAGPAPVLRDAADGARVLHGLDAARAAAFAARDPAALRRVYTSAQLLARDRALLLAVVPPGCRLVDLRTDYGGVRVLRAAQSAATVAARATVRPSRLRCAGAPAGSARGAPPISVEIRLVRSADGYRISSIRPRAPS